MAQEFKMELELLQPWSTFVLKTKLPPPILQKMIKITDEIVENRAGRGDDVGVGQVEDQFNIDLEILEREEILGFFLDMCNTYVIQAQYQSQPTNKEQIANEKWLTQLTLMWINSQKDNEYFPIHHHAECDLSSAMYLKIPEYLPNRTKERFDERDGSITFTNNSSTDKRWGNPMMTLQPQVGDFFIFPATQMHFVYPFRTPDGKGERRSVSFNAEFRSKSKQEEKP